MKGEAVGRQNLFPRGMIQRSVTIPDSLEEYLHKVAERHRISVSAYVREVLLERQLAEEEALKTQCSVGESVIAEKNTGQLARGVIESMEDEGILVYFEDGGARLFDYSSVKVDTPHVLVGGA
jgi:predicted DNA-binding protein